MKTYLEKLLLNWISSTVQYPESHRYTWIDMRKSIAHKQQEYLTDSKRWLWCLCFPYTKVWFTAILHPFLLHPFSPVSLQPVCASIFYFFSSHSSQTGFISMTSGVVVTQKRKITLNHYSSWIAVAAAVKMSNCFFSSSITLKVLKSSQIQQCQEHKLPEHNSGRL